jgi:hypothetical protein
MVTLAYGREEYHPRRTSGEHPKAAPAGIQCCRGYSLYSGTVGLFETYGHPEVVLSGLNTELAQTLLNDIGSAVA